MSRPATEQDAINALKIAQLKSGHLLNTRKQYRSWMLRYRRARESRIVSDLQGFLDHLSAHEKVSPKTVKQALNALVYYHREVLDMKFDNLRTPRVNPNKNVPVYLTHPEVLALLSHMTGLPRLQAEFLYGTGSRITAMLTLRLKDLDLGKGLVVFRWDKGRKSRTVRLPAFIMPRLNAHIAAIRLQWESDHAKGIACPYPDPSLVKKLGRRQFTRLPWYWLFPSGKIRGENRWHGTDKALTSSISRAADAAGIMKRVSPHVLRHSNASALLERGENIRRIQEHLGHSNLETTEIYLHATGTESMLSPLDLPPAVAPPALVPFPSIGPAARKA